MSQRSRPDKAKVARFVDSTPPEVLSAMTKLLAARPNLTAAEEAAINAWLTTNITEGLRMGGSHAVLEAVFPKDSDYFLTGGTIGRSANTS